MSPPVVTLAKVKSTPGCAVELVSYPSGVYLELIVVHDEDPPRSQMIYSERLDNVMKIAERLAAGEIGV